MQKKNRPPAPRQVDALAYPHARGAASVGAAHGQHLYAQLFTADGSKVLASASTVQTELREG